MRSALRTAVGPALFVTGSARSGTELLRAVLNRHPRVHIAAETHYFEDLRPRLPDGDAAAARRLALAAFAGLRGSAYGLDGAEATIPPDRARADLLAEAGAQASGDALFHAHCRIAARDAGRPDPDLWGEKTPRHVFAGDRILAAFPQARIVHMLRDPRAAVASYRDWTNHWYDGRAVPEPLGAALAAEAARVAATRSITVQALMWRAAADAARALRARHGPDRVRIQSFEALLANPAEEIAALCAFAGLEPAPGMDRIGRVNSSYGPRSDAGGFEPAAATDWRARLAPAEIWWVERLTGAEARGYPRESRRAYPGFALVELARTARRLPAMAAANRHRAGHHAGMIMARVRPLLGNPRL